jgi:hypothetical protein
MEVPAFFVLGNPSVSQPFSGFCAVVSLDQRLLP